MLKHYVEYMHNPVMNMLTSIQEVPERDVNKVQIPEGRPCFGFRFFDKMEEIVDGKPLTGKRENVSGWYYFGKRGSLEELKALPDSKRRLYEATIRTMESNGFTEFVVTKTGGIRLMLEDKDTVIEGS